MKKLTLLAACMLTATMVYGQGRVQFANSSTTAVTTNWTGAGASGNMAGAGLYTVGLFMGPTGSGYGSLAPVAYAVNSLSGRFSGGGNLVLPAPYDGTAAVAFQVRAWSTALGSTWADVNGKLTSYNGAGQATANFMFPAGSLYLGSSAIGSVLPATGIATSSLLFGTGNGQIGGFAMYDVIPTPEPGTLALVGLGLTGLLFIRRRK